jgi:hypothetical protein
VSEAKVYRRLPAGGVIGPAPIATASIGAATRNWRRRRGGLGSGLSMASCRSRSARSNAIQYCAHQPVVERQQSVESPALSDRARISVPARRDRASLMVDGLAVVTPPDSDDMLARFSQPLALGGTAGGTSPARRRPSRLGRRRPSLSVYSLLDRRRFDQRAAPNGQDDTASSLVARAEKAGRSRLERARDTPA